MQAAEDLYAILQVDPRASQEVIEAAYHRLARIYHPDVNPDPGAARMMTRLNAAYEVLGDPDRRASYDRDRRATGPTPTNSEEFYRSVGTRATWTLVFLAAVAAAASAYAFSTLGEVQLLQRIAAGDSVSDAEVVANDDRQVAIISAYFVALLCTVVAFCFWIHGASRNLRALGVHPQRFSPAWAVGWWFVPIFNLFRPYQVMKEIWQGSHPSTLSTGPSELNSSHVSPLLGWWWAAWLMAAYVGGPPEIVSGETGQTVEDLITADYFSVAGDFITVLAGALAIVLVRQISANQDVKHRKVLDLRGQVSTQRVNDDPYSWGASNPPREGTLMRRAQTGVGRFVQIIGGVVMIGSAIGTLLFTWYVLFSTIGVWALLIGIFLTPLTLLAAVLIVWFSTGSFPVIVLLLWLGTWAGIVLIGLGGVIAGDS